MPGAERTWTAFHEAGHAVAALACNVWFWDVKVATADEMRDGWKDDRGRHIRGAGCISMRTGSFGAMPRAGVLASTSAAHPRSSIVVGIEAEMVATIAGPLAEARRRRVGSFMIFMGPGRDDLEHISRIGRLWYPDDQEGAWRRAQRAARRIIATREGWGEVTRLADRLIQVGTVERLECARLCPKAAAAGERSRATAAI